MTILLIPIFALFPFFAAFTYRVRGMAHSWGTQINRILCWGIPNMAFCALLAYAWQLPLWLAPICGLLAFLGSIPGHASEQDGSFTHCMEMGLITLAMLIVELLPFEYWAVKNNLADMQIVFGITELMGFLSALGYYLGYRYQITLKLLGVLWCEPGNNTTCSELYTGFLAFGMPLMVLGMIGIWAHI